MYFGKGARWNEEKHKIDDALLKHLYQKMPIVLKILLFSFHVFKIMLDLVDSKRKRGENKKGS